MFKFSGVQINDIWAIVEDEYDEPNGELIVREGLTLLEKLVNSDINGYLNKEYVRALEDNINGRVVVDLIEGMMKRIRQLGGIEVGNVPEEVKRGLAKYYCELGIMDELVDTYAKIAPGKQLHYFVEKYVKLPAHNWPGHQLSYVYAWKYRNIIDHGEAHKLKSVEDWPLVRKSYYVVLIDICIRFKEHIEKRYHRTLIKNIKFDNYKKSLIAKSDRGEFFEKYFTPLFWGDEKLEWKEAERAIILIGEAGAGKTTQMESLYWAELNSEKETLPVWIKIQELEKMEGNDKLIKAIKKQLDKYAEWYEDVMTEGFVTLYLDGLNELLINDGGESARLLLLSVEKLIENYPSLRVCMTDRNVQLKKSVINSVYSCTSMSETACKEYSSKYWSEAVVQQIMDFIKNPQNRWFSDSRDGIITPEKMNGLGEMIDLGQTPQDKKDYYVKFLAHILKREYIEKHDDRIPKLKHLLYHLSQEMDNNMTLMSENKIVTIFASKLGGGYDTEKALEYFNLARRIPMIIYREITTPRGEVKKGYVFAYSAYFQCFKNDEEITLD